MRSLHPWLYALEAAEQVVMTAPPDRVLPVLEWEARSAQLYGGTASEGLPWPPRRTWLASLLLAAVVAGVDARAAARVIADVVRRYPRADERGGS